MESKIEIQARNFWDKTWSRFLKYHGMIAPSAKLVQHLFNYVPRKGTILDLGCGEGRNSLYLSQVGYNIIGLDFSLKAVKVMNNNFFEESLKGHAINADARNLPLRNSSIDGILAHHLLDHLDKAGLESAFKEVYRILKPEGVMLFTMDSFSESLNEPGAVSKDDGSIVFLKGTQKGMLVRPFKPDELAVLPANGWEIIKDELTPSNSKIMLIKKEEKNPVI
ncbi:MAG: methyltransferase domain-containing protein [Candidatus Rifleibacteriota bacterium]